jgi:hypothetical protein
MKTSHEGHFTAHTSPFSTIQAGIQSAIKRQSLGPLVRSIELSLVASRQAKESKGNTIFSCDSFCQPHLESQIRLYKALERLHSGQTRFINFPISHYITSLPNTSLLELSDQPLKILELNKQLLVQQEDNFQWMPNDSRILIGSECHQSIARDYEKLLACLDPSNWASISINGFPFHELAHRDLSLTYKCTPDLTEDENRPFFWHYIQSNKFNLFLLCVIACEERIGASCFCMSYYTANAVFLFYCQQTKRTIRYFGPPSLALEDFGMSNNLYMCIAASPVSSIELTRPSVRSELSEMPLSSKTFEIVKSVIERRFNGKGSHTYSTGIDVSNSNTKGHVDWINEQRGLGRQVVSLYTSSPDELIGQKFSFKHFNADISHLCPSVFSDQEAWLEEIVAYFSGKDKSSSLIIRLHPRLAKDKRGLPESPYLPALWSKLSKCIKDDKRIRLVHPADPVSSYWLGLQSDLILNGWSTIGLEFAMKDKMVTNAFYKCPLGGSAVYPVHSRSEPLKSPTEYFQRIQRLLLCITENVMPNESDYISAEEAAKAFIAAFTAGLVDLSNPCLLRSQLASPSVLTPETISVILGSDL